MGMVYKRGKTYWIKYYRNGKPYFESARSTKETDAKRLMKRREGEISEGKLPGIYFDRVRFDDLAESFLTDYRINQKKSLVKAQRSARHLKRYFEGFRVTQIITPKIQHYIEGRQGEGAANATINRELAALKRMLNMGAKQTPAKVDKVPFIPMLKEDNVRKGFFEYGDFLSLREALPSYLQGFTTFGYKTGMRVAEISGIEWKQVELNNRIVRLDPGETKTDEGRSIYLDDELNEIFTQLSEARKKGKMILPSVFLNKDGTDKIKQFSKAWKRACEDAGIGKRLFHDFRRTAIRNMIRAGVPEKVAMMISGHKTRSVFERYNIVNEDDLKLAAEKQEAYLEAQKVIKKVNVYPINKKARYQKKDDSGSKI